MDAQDFRSLQEAYLEVVENQQLDEISQRTAPIAESDYNYQRALQSKKQGKKTMRKAIGGKIDAATKRIKDMKKKWRMVQGASRHLRHHPLTLT
jgi:erythromycin esterase-like protein